MEMNDSLSVGALIQRHGRPKVAKFLNAVKKQNSAIPGHGFRRTFYNYLKTKWQPKTTGVIISESFLRSDIILGSASSYTFSVNESDGANVNGLAILPTTQRINQNDVFEACEWALVIWTQDTTNNPAFSTRRLYTYPNPFVFSGAAVAGVAEADALEAIYNAGRISLVIGTTTIIPRLDALRFYRVPVTQEGNPSAAIAGPVIYRQQRDGYNNASFPFDENIPFLTLNGNGKNQVQLTLPEGVNFLPATYSRSNAANYCSLLLRGFLVANGAKQSNRALT